MVSSIWAKALGLLAAVGAILAAILKIRSDAKTAGRDEVRAEAAERVIKAVEIRNDAEVETRDLSDSDLVDGLRRPADRRG